MLTVSADFKIIPNNGLQEFIFEGDTGNFLVTGNVGIGTTSPRFTQDIVTSGGARIRNSSTTTGNKALQWFTVTTNNDNEGDFSTYIGANRTSSSQTDLVFGAWSGTIEGVDNPASEKMRITGLGNVGIGTNNPQANLDISSTGTGDSMIIRNDDASSSAAPVLMLLRDSASAADGDYLGQIKFKGNSDTGAERVYAKITAKISDATNGAEDSLIETAVRNNGSNLIVSRQTHQNLKLINGTGLESDGDVYIPTVGKGLVIKSPNGTRYRITVDNSGNLGTELA